MLRRRPRPLVRAAGIAATTAVVAGTAGAVHHHQQQKYAQQDYANQQMVAQQAAPPPQQVVYVPAPEAALAPPAESDLMAQLQQLAQMHAAGVLNDEEFAAAKQKLLAG
jgi:hypothetical protein